MKHAAYILFVSSLLIALYAYTGSQKLLEPALFAAAIKGDPFLNPYAGFIAATLPIVEIVLATGIAFGRTRTLFLWASFAFLLLLTIYVSSQMLMHHALPCVCGGVISRLSWPQHLLFNGVLLILNLSAIVPFHATSSLEIRKASPDSLQHILRKIRRSRKPV